MLKFHSFLFLGSSRIENLKRDEVESVDLNEEISCKHRVPGAKTEENVTCCWSDDGYQNLPQVSLKASSLSNSSKQGDGDQHPTMRESPAFTRLNLQTVEPFDQSHKTSSNSSLNSSDHIEIMQELQKEINGLSFDSNLVSDNDTDDGEEISSKSFKNLQISFPGNETDNDNVISAGYQNQIDQNCQNTIPHSHKFCQYNNVQYFPNNMFPPNYCQLVDDSYKKYEALDDEEEERLLSDSSEELVNIDGEEEMIPIQEYVVSGRSTRFATTPSSINIPTQHPKPSTSTDMSCPDEVNSSTIPKSHLPNWEENDEVQVNVIEPTETPGDIDDVIKTRQYWSNVGLFQEKVIDRKYLGPTDQIEGIESVPGVQLVEEKCLRKTSDEMLWMSKSDSLERSLPQANRPQSALEPGQLNFLTLRTKEKSSKKKRTLVARLAGSFTNLFRSKRKPATKINKT